jgi:hypothetical protein
VTTPGSPIQLAHRQLSLDHDPHHPGPAMAGAFDTALSMTEARLPAAQPTPQQIRSPMSCHIFDPRTRTVVADAPRTPTTGYPPRVSLINAPGSPALHSR